MNGYRHIEFAPTDNGATLHMARWDQLATFDVTALDVEAATVFCTMADDGACLGDLLIIPKYYGFDVWLTGQGFAGRIQDNG